MFEIFRDFLIYTFILVLLLTLVLVPMTFHFQRPQLPDSQVTLNEIDNYKQVLDVLEAPKIRQPTTVHLPLREVSYLLENFLPRYRKYGIRVEDLHVKQTGNNARVRVVLDFPLGLWLKIDMSGRASVRNGRWIVHANSLTVGNLPVHWVWPPEPWNSPLPTRYDRGNLRIHSGRINGDGVRLTITHEGLGIDIPGIPKISADDQKLDKFKKWFK
ncbi:MAG: hypothetical protein ABEJ65_03905 [bacterium]